MGQLHLRKIERAVSCTGGHAASLRVHQHCCPPVLVTFEVLYPNETPEGAAGDRRRTTPKRWVVNTMVPRERPSITLLWSRSLTSSLSVLLGPLLKVEFWHPTNPPFFMLRDLQTTRERAETDGASPVLTAGDLDGSARVRRSRGSAICGHDCSCRPHCAGGLPGPAFGGKRALRPTDGPGAASDRAMRRQR